MSVERFAHLVTMCRAWPCFSLSVAGLLPRRGGLLAHGQAGRGPGAEQEGPELLQPV